MPSKCQVCRKCASFGIRGSKRATHCGPHKLPGMVDVKNPTCAMDECETIPYFGIRGSKRATHCGPHKLPGMVDVKNPTCAMADCGKQPYFGTRGSKRATHCGPHKLPGMVDVKSPTCATDDCETRPSFGIRGSKRATHCDEHKLPGMVDVINPTCATDDCETRPSFGIRGSKRATHCDEHKLPGMVNVKYPTCKSECCTANQTPSLAKFRHPQSRIPICTWKARNLVKEAIQAGDVKLVDRLNRRFGFKRTIAIRMEHIWYYEMVKRVPRLATMKRALDESVLSKIVGKQKSVDDPRPDYYHLHDIQNLAIHGEFDENDDHEDDDMRLRAISHHAGCGIERTYVFRIAAHMNDRDRALFRRKKSREGVVSYTMTERGKAVLEQVVEYLNGVLERIDKGLVPDERIRKVYF